MDWKFWILTMSWLMKKFEQYNMMLYVKLPKQMLAEFKRLYLNKTSAMHVAWSVDDKDNIKFYATIGNNILLLLMILCC